ncbi:MAG TPA: hypothetical protein DIC60_04135 [Lachnospiraceae bacterium]|nr:hypothetical protein [Lachnospiraceae bacterium]
MNEVTVRNLEVIENEIIQLKEQTARNIIMIGQALIEAKNQLNHGEWGTWLEEKFDFTQRTANKFMQLATTFNVSNSNSLSNLGQTKLFLLMDIADENRDIFLEENDVETMTTRELKQKINNFKNVSNELERDYNVYDVNISELKEFPNHEKYFPNIVGQEYIKFLRSIEDVGVVEPIVITQDKIIVSGHQRVRACKDLGIEIIPAYYFYYDKTKNDSYEKELFSWFCSGNCMRGQMEYYREAKKHLDKMK